MDVNVEEKKEEEKDVFLADQAVENLENPTTLEESPQEEIINQTAEKIQ